ncbi:MAG TPA: glycosyltransferase family 39 protein, partial [Armatimonadota bacterium]|nr:glycosyltransferase family 39 protein [Armatimonadota bacterium]
MTARPDTPKVRPPRGVWLLLLVILASRIALVACASHLHGGDGGRYMREAVNMVDHGVFSADDAAPPQPSAHDAPLYPLLLAGLYKASGGVHLAGRLASYLNAFIFAIAALGVYRLASRLSREHGQTVGVASVVVFALMPGSLPYSVFHMPDTLFACILIWASVLLVEHALTHRSACAIGAFALIGVSVMVKPVALLFPLVLCVVVIGMARATPLKRRLLVAGLGLLIHGGALLPWCARNWVVFGVPHLSSIVGTNTFGENYRVMLEELGVEHVGGVMAQQRKAARIASGTEWENPMVRSAALTDIAKREVMAHLPTYLMAAVKQHPRLYIGTGTIALVGMLGVSPDDPRFDLEIAKRARSPRDVLQLPPLMLALQISAWVVLLGCYALVVLGIWRSARSADPAGRRLLLLGLLYFALIYGPLTATRYRFAMTPYMS